METRISHGMCGLKIFEGAISSNTVSMFVGNALYFITYLQPGFLVPYWILIIASVCCIHGLGDLAAGPKGYGKEPEKL